MAPHDSKCPAEQVVWKPGLLDRMKQYPVLSGYFMLIILIRLYFTAKAVCDIPPNYYLWHLELLREIGQFFYAKAI